MKSALIWPNLLTFSRVLLVIPFVMYFPDPATRGQHAAEHPVQGAEERLVEPVLRGTGLRPVRLDHPALTFRGRLLPPGGRHGSAEQPVPGGARRSLWFDLGGEQRLVEDRQRACPGPFDQLVVQPPQLR